MYDKEIEKEERVTETDRQKREIDKESQRQRRERGKKEEEGERQSTGTVCRQGIASAKALRLERDIKGRLAAHTAPITPFFAKHI